MARRSGLAKKSKHQAREKGQLLLDSFVSSSVVSIDQKRKERERGKGREKKERQKRREAQRPQIELVEAVPIREDVATREEAETRAETPRQQSRKKVTAEILDAQAKGPKLHHYHWRRRKASRRKTGHRQKYIQVRITKIVA